MGVPLKLLLVEDSSDDAALVERELRRAGFDPLCQVVETPEAFRAALDRDDWQIVLADYSLPRFTGWEALSILRQAGRDTPFILISGTVGEEVAVESMKAGANDYLLKQNLTRLAPAVKRELQAAAGRQQRKAAEAALRASQAILSLVYNHSSDFLALLAVAADGSMSVASMNRTLLERAANGSPAREEDYLGRPFEAILREALGFDAETIRRLLARCRETVRTRERALFEMPVPGEPTGIWTEQNLIPVVDHDDRLRHVLWVWRDISQRKAAEERERLLEAKLARARKMEALGTLAGGIAHDFNNLLTAIIGQAELIKLDLAPETPALESAQHLLRAAYRAKDLVRQILTFSRRQPPQVRPLALGGVVEEAVRIFRQTAPEYVQVKTRIDPHPLVVSADATQIHQLVLNLCTNAAHAITEAGGAVTIGLTAVDVEPAFAALHPPLRPGPAARLSVVDTGRGMDAATLEHMFEPFFTTKPLGVGTGLGLAVVHGIVESHGGAITVSSEPGRGSSFEVYFPRLGVEPETEGEIVRRAPRGSGERIYLIDDEPQVLQVGASALERLGYLPASFSNPQSAVEAFLADPRAARLVITDLSMPTLGGIQLARKFWQIRPELPIVLITGFSGSIDQADARKLGFVAMLQKPFRIDQLADAVSKALAATQPAAK